MDFTLNDGFKKNLSLRSTSILVLGGSVESTSRICHALSKLGFSNTRSANNIDELEAKEFWDSCHVEWLIIGDLFNDCEPSQRYLAFVQRISQSYKIFISYVSSKLNSPINNYLIAGSSSWHICDPNEEQIVCGFENLIAQATASVQPAEGLRSFYTRQYLLICNKYSELIEHDLKIIDQNQNSPRLLLNLAQSNHLTGNSSAAITLLVQAKNMDSRLSDSIAAVYAKIKAETASKSANRTQTAHNGVETKQQNCIIIESDSSVVKQMTDGLSSLGIPSSITFDGGADAWDWLAHNPEPTLIITEWKMKGLGGSQLVQRIRAHGLNSVPVVVCSSKVPHNELPLFRELSIAHLLKKPFSERDFKIALTWALQQHQRPTNQLALEKEIFLAIRRGDWKTAHNLKAAYLSNGKIYESRKKLLEAEFLYHQQKYSSAIDIAKSAAKISEIDSLDLIDLMGRCYDKIGGHSAAKKFFEIAEKMSPGNIQRKCDLVDLYDRAGNSDLAEQKLNAVLALDNSCEQTLESTLKHALSIGNHEKVDQIAEKIQDKSRVLKHLNNWSVHLTKLNRIEDGIKVYKQILKLLPIDQKATRARVSYNLALGLIKIDSAKESLIVLQTININDYPPIKQKLESLRNRIEKALNSGNRFESNDTKNTDSSNSVIRGDSLMAVKNIAATGNIMNVNSGDLIGELEDISTQQSSSTSKKVVA